MRGPPRTHAVEGEPATTIVFLPVSELVLQPWEHWNLQCATIDSSGIGAGLASFLEARKPDRAERYVFTAPSKSRLAYETLGMINGQRLTTYTHDQSPEAREYWKEIAACRYQLRTNETMTWSVPATEGHDDFVASLLLAAHAAQQTVPPAAAGIIRARPHDDTRW